MDRFGTWGTDTEMVTLAHMLQTCIFSYNTEEHTWHRYTPENLDRTWQDDLTKMAMYLRHPYNHFDVVLSTLPWWDPVGLSLIYIAVQVMHCCQWCTIYCALGWIPKQVFNITGAHCQIGEIVLMCIHVRPHHHTKFSQHAWCLSFFASHSLSIPWWCDLVFYTSHMQSQPTCKAIAASGCWFSR